jgi:hypothetical protein
MPYQTLPPTWTPTVTFTPLPTRTATPTSTPITAESICKEFQVVISPDPRVIVPEKGQVTFGWKGIPADAPMAFVINKRGSKAGIAANVPIAGDGLFPLPISKLPQAVDFTWKIWLQHPTLGAMCLRQGYFRRRLILTF